MSGPKQIIVMRKDLNMRKGKIAAQAAHASMAVILDQMHETYVDDIHQRAMYYQPESALEQWLNGRFTKICVYVNSEEELLKVYADAQNKGFLCSLIKDAGLTEFGGVPTYTCCAIGPEFPEALDPITGHLPLL